MELTFAAGVAPPSLSDSPSHFQRFRRFFSHYRVRISVAVFVALMAEDVLVGVIPHDPFNLTDPKSAAGLALVLAGVGLRSWAAGIVRKDRQLATSGPYALVRHPLYLGSFLMMVGFCLIIDDVENIWLVLGPMLAIYLLMIRDEERRLAARFGQAWEDYIQRTPAFFPSFPSRLPAVGVASWDMRQWLSNKEFRALFGVIAGIAAIEVWRHA